MNNYYKLDELIKDIAIFEYSFFLNKSNVVGVGFGYKIRSGFYTGEKCIKVFVNTKISKDRLNHNDVIPNRYKGILTDVDEVGEFKFQMLNRKVRPLIGGYSIGANVLGHYINTGSIGCLVKDNYNIYLLSSAHVLSDFNRLAPETSIVQPSLLDGGAPIDEVGKLSRYIPLKAEGIFQKPKNLIDAAIVRLDVDAYTDIAFLGKLRGVDTVNLQEIVFKVGRTSEETSGMVTSINTTCEAVLQNQGKKEKYLFKDQILTSKMSEDGDSGAVLVKGNKKVAGLLVGGSTSGSIFNNINDVLSSLNVSIVI